jgi:enoyl-CoA hydratase/carnithine racemase
VTRPTRRTPERRRPDDTAGLVQVARADGCVTATLVGYGRHNRLSAAMAHQLTALVEEVEDDPDALMLSLRGTDGAFCAGFDDDVYAEAPRVVEAFAALSKPTLAIIAGAAADEGLELALAADIRIASRSARFSMGQLERGRLPCFGGTQRLPRLIGAAHALRMLLAGDAVEANEAIRLGLVTYIAPGPRELVRAAGEIARSVTARGPVAARLAKEAVHKGCDLTLDQGIRLEEDLYALLQTTADRAEGIRAFLEKRKPLFRGA